MRVTHWPAMALGTFGIFRSTSRAFSDAGSSTTVTHSTVPMEQTTSPGSTVPVPTALHIWSIAPTTRPTLEARGKPSARAASRLGEPRHVPAWTLSGRAVRPIPA
jgi:hypothetical protein